MLDLRLATSRFDFADLGLAPGADATQKSSDGRLFSDAPWNIPVLDSFDAAIKLSGQEFIHGDLKLTNASAELALIAGKLTVTSLIGNVGDGRVALGGTLDTKASPAFLDARFRADKVAAGPLLSALGASGMISGDHANLELALAGPASSLHGLLDAAKGNALFEMGQGRLESALVRLVFSGLGDLITFGGTGDSARVNCLVTRFKIDDGIAMGRGIVLDTPGVTVLGTGDIDLGAERINLRLDSNSKQVNLANLAVPITVSGPLASPNVVPDPVGAVGDTVDFAAQTANLASFGVLSSLTGLGESQDMGADPCSAALEAGNKASAPSTVESVTQGAGDVLEGIGEGAKDLGEGAGNVLEGIGEGIGDLFGN
jgi:AsmA family protein